MADQRKRIGGLGDASAHEAELALFRNRLAHVAYRLGLHESSVVRELGSAQVDALRSLRGLLALPRRLWRLAARARRGTERQNLDSQALDLVVDQALGEYREHGFAGTDAFISAQFLSMRERAQVYAGFAHALLPLSGYDAARAADIALTFEHDPSLVLRLALLKHGAGQLTSAVETLARLPAGHPTTVTEDEAIARLRGFARLALKPPSIPRRADGQLRSGGRQSVMLVLEGHEKECFGARDRAVRLARELAASGMQVSLVIPGGAALDLISQSILKELDALDGVAMVRLKADPEGVAPDEWFKLATRELGEIARASGATLCHVAGTYRLGVPMLLAARPVGAAVVYERFAFPEYEGGEHSADWRLSELFQLEQSLEALVCAHADVVIVATRKQSEEVRRRAGPDQVEVQQLAPPVPIDAGAAHGADLRREYGLSEDDIIVGFVHDRRTFEGLDDLVAALAARRPARSLRLLVLSCVELPAQERRVIESVAGVVVADRLDARTLADSLAVCDCVAFPWKATAASDLAYSPALLQAMAAGVPVLVSSCFAFAEVALDGVNARVHAAGNPQALGRCLEDLLGQRPAALRMAAAARVAARREHSWAGYVEQLLASYRDASGEPGVESAVEADNASLPGIAGRPRLRVAAIMDEFTHSCFAAECELVQLTPGDWHAQITELEPDFLLVESAWQGFNGEWEKQIPQASSELRKLIVHCRKKGIRTAFWNKEDPVHFSLFLGTARLFDTVFTTDIDRIKAYREKLGHDRVYLLPFACQPQVHNPVERYQRLDAFCFAGSYYAKYPERREDFEQLMDAARSFRKVDIFDRNHGKQDPGLAFPPEYQDLVVGSLPVSEIDRAYKGYRFGITVNTVKQSQSMFARRAFELLACNTLTISNFSRGLKLLLGDLVICGGSAASISSLLHRRAGDEGQARRFRLAGLRKVMDEHTYAHRMAYLSGKVLGRDTGLPAPPLVAFCAVTSQAAVEHAVAVFDSQSATSRRLVLVVEDGMLPVIPVRPDVGVLTRHQASVTRPAERWPDSHLTVFDCRDHYSRHYLKDLQLAVAYAGTAAVGKVAHFVLDGVAPRLEGEGAQYRIHEARWPLRRSLVAGTALPGLSIGDLLERDFQAPAMAGLAIDEFNYCRDGAGAARADDVDSDIPVDEGIAMSSLLEISEASGNSAETAALEARPGFHGDALQKLFTPAVHGEGLLQVSHSLDGVVLESRLATKQHAYAYASRLFKRSELVDDGFLRFQLVTEAGLYVNAAVVYLDAARNKLSHAIVSSDTNQALPVPAATAWIRFGLRVLGPGCTTVKALVKGALAPAMDHIVGRGNALLITKDYPRYDDLYRYGFVHRRILAYAEAGRHVDVFRFSNAPLRFDEFEGVNVVAGQAEHLGMLLEGGAYDTVLVHAMDPLMWEHVKPLLETRRVVVWVHGAEIQPWFRRLSNAGADQAAREMTRRSSNRRLAMWEDVLRHPHPNLRVVFVSRYLEEEALGDLGVRLPEGQVHVIPNYVDGSLFRYERKDEALRGRILSVRPFASPVYANDLTVKAIEILAAEPFFEELQFTIVGDGPLFDRTVEPLRQYPNVRLEKRFLSQSAIAALHREHGVFLVPSRMDSQGVSRDEAMASGLVPVTTRIAAIPEFVDGDCAILAEPEDAAGLAAGIARLWSDPALFGSMSAAAAERVRRISEKDSTIGKELALIEGQQPVRAGFHAPSPTPLQRIAIYGDVNLNITDGSAIWAASLAEVLAGSPQVAVTLYLKATIVQTHVIAPLLAVPGLRIVEPVEKALTPTAALDTIEHDDQVLRYDAVVLRGMDLCEQAAARPVLHGRLWVYLTDVPQTPELATPEISRRVARIVEAAGIVLCQTPQFRDYMEGWIPDAAGRTRLLPPMVPVPQTVEEEPSGDGLHIVYAGKFAPLWGVREMLDAIAILRANGHAVTLHVYGDKIHNPADDPEFRPEITRRLQGSDGVVWHGAVERSQLLGELQRMHVGWAWRHAALENGTHELSTKLLEYASARVPPIMARNAVNLSVFGDAYPLYADTLEDVVALVGRLASDPTMRAAAVEAAMAASSHFDFDSVRQFIRAQGLVRAASPRASTVPHHPWVSK
ncbi:glycosyltransferase [Luteimonas viscosa]|nr:glycosyltransferase [Luteimonas viscosa]